MLEKQVFECNTRDLEECYQAALATVIAYKSDCVVEQVKAYSNFQRKITPELLLMIENKIAVLSIIIKDQEDEIQALYKRLNTTRKLSLMKRLRNKLICLNMWPSRKL